MTAASSCWKLAGDEARLECGLLAGRLLLGRVGEGIGEISWNGRPAASLVPLQLICGTDHPDCRHSETYIRGSDLVSTYVSQSPLGTPEIYWRARHIPSHSAVGFEVVLSKHTQFLDSQPRSAVHSVAAGELWHSTAISVQGFSQLAASQLPVEFQSEAGETHLLVVRNPELQLSYAQLVFPSDFDAAEITSEQDGRWRIKSFLFPERLEKGVIRRARVCGWFLPAENDLAIAVELARQFIDEPLPLTT